MAKNKRLEMIEDWLLSVGAVNIGITVFNWNAIEALDGVVGGTGVLKTIVYGAVGLSGVHKIYRMLT